MSRRLPFLALAGLVVLLHVFPVYANDLWMHLLLGRDLLEAGLPHQEVYSYTAAGYPFVYHEWLSGVLLQWLHSLGGSTALIALQPACALLIVFLLYRAARWLGAEPTVIALVLGLGIYVASFRLFVRPHLLALPLLAAMLLLLERFRRRGGVGVVIGMIGIQVLWTNLHGSFPEGVALAALFVLGESVRRWFGHDDNLDSAPPLGWFLALPVLLAAATLVNPYGWELVWLSVTHPVDPLFRSQIFEYFPVFSAPIRATRIFPLALGWMVLLGSAIWMGRKKVLPAHLFPIAAFLGLAIWMHRAVPELIIVSAPTVALGLGAGRLRSARFRLVAAILLLAAAVSVPVFGYRLDREAVRRMGLGVDPFTPVSATDKLEAAGFHGNIFASFPYGSYLAYRLAPKARIVFDSRTIPYGAELYREFHQARASLAGFRNHLARYRVDAVLLNFKLDGAPDLHAFLGGGPDWGLVYFDEEAVLYVRRTAETATWLDRDRIDCANPVLFDQRGIPRELAAICRLECRRMLDRDPAAVLPRFLLAAALRSEGLPREALKETDHLLSTAPGRAHVHRLRALIFQELGQPDQARREEQAAETLERR